MSPLNINPEEEVTLPKKKKNKTLKVMLGIAALVAVPVVGTTLAAQITINSNNSNEVNFGQGTADTAACDGDITTAASSVYSTGFKLEKIILSDIDLSTAGSNCAGKTFIVSVDDGTGIEAAISSGVTQVSFTIPAEVTSGATALTNVTAGFTAVMTDAIGDSYQSGAPAVAYDDEATIEITIDTPLLASTSVSTFLIQSS
jgi:hypothetical protein